MKTLEEIKNLTDEELGVTLFKSLHPDYEEAEQDGYRFLIKGKKGEGGVFEVPNFKTNRLVNSLDAIAEVEKTVIERFSGTKYMYALQDAALHKWEYVPYVATARQRAEACLLLLSENK